MCMFQIGLRLIQMGGFVFLYVLQFAEILVGPHVDAAQVCSQQRWIPFRTPSVTA